MTQHIFLVEIGTEELPPKALRALAEAFANNICSELDRASIRHGEISWFASPRRLAVKVAALSGTQADSDVEKRGPAISQAFDADGNPTQAAQCWARACSITVRQAKRFATEKGEWLIYRTRVKGRPVQDLLCNMVRRALSNLPIPKMMRWGDKDTQFIRPVHTVTMLLDDSVIPGKVLGINADRILRGHRFMNQQEISLEHADQYTQVLFTRGQVMADYVQRKATIRRNVEVAAKRLGGMADLSDSLLEEVTSLVEWPVVLTARFEDKFLAVPSEALIYTMKSHQKYFPVHDAKGNLLSHFIFVANIESKYPQQIITGNEKVVRSRLADAEFFFNTDRKQRLEDRLPLLETVIFQKQLGTMRDKSRRIEALAAWIATRIDAHVPQAARAGLLSKCDLMTNIVFEFTDTQGVIGMHYARYDGEPEPVALAQKEQYQPRFAGDELPTTLVSCAVAIADKMDILAGIFGMGPLSKSDKDPFALRRAAIGVLRIIIEKQLPIDLKTLTEEAVRLYGNKLIHGAVVNHNIIDFMFGRLRSWYQEQGYSIDVIQAVLARRPTCPMDFDARVRAVSSFRSLKEAAELAATHKRVSNILANSEKLIPANLQIQISLLKEPAEIMLATQMVGLSEKLQPMLKACCYKDALVDMATLREPVDIFFNSVMVMVEDHQVKVNRLTLLAQLRELFLLVADISLLHHP